MVGASIRNSISPGITVATYAVGAAVPSSGSSHVSAMELSPPVAITLRGIAGQLVVTTSVSSTGTVVLVVEELGIVVDVVDVVDVLDVVEVDVLDVVDVVDVVELVDVVVVDGTDVVDEGTSADIESTSFANGASDDELDGTTVEVELGATVEDELAGIVEVELDGATEESVGGTTVVSVGASSTIGVSTHIPTGSISSVALAEATGNSATTAAKTATKLATRLSVRAHNNPVVPSTPRILRN